MKNYMPLFILFITLAMSCNSGVQKEDTKNTSVQEAETKMVNINVEEFKEKMTAPNVVILDVRTPGETAEGKIVGALELDVKESGFIDKIKELDKNKTYLVYCRSGRRSVAACDIMGSQGFKNLYNLEGGYIAWEEEQNN